ncbi:hypothetical protein QR685DRAFT_599890 [Neurospora intermedia]|uniref:Uncharacterized protein n=1 Tax=Neurospora intermedia TaxID=5142 RepID=A0ABR3D392_NEUIN
MSSRLKSLNPWVGTRETARTSARRYANHKAPRRAYTPSIPSYSPGTSCMRGPFSALHGPGMQQATVTVERGRTQVRSRETHKFTRWVPSCVESSTGLPRASPKYAGGERFCTEDFEIRGIVFTCHAYTHHPWSVRHHMRSTTSAGYIDRARSLHCELPE